MSTRDRILDTAIALFNEQGTSAVSTNHIAEAAGISPGNLYYHYRNKQEIIRDLFERLFALWDVSFDLPADRSPSLAELRGLVEANFRIMSQYRFVYRELIALLRADETLQTRYAAVRERGYEGFRIIIAALVESGTLIRSLDHVAVEQLADLCWLISEFWLSTLEISGQPLDDAQLIRGIDLMMGVLQPYLAA